MKAGRTVTVTLTSRELDYLLMLATVEADMQEESQHCPKETAQLRAQTVLRKLWQAFRAQGVAA